MKKVTHQSNLERLIEKCGDRFSSILRAQNGRWLALAHPEIKGEGSTPTEAVENLIKALNKQ